MNQQVGYSHNSGIDGSDAEQIELDTLAEFSQVTEWKKDVWSNIERGYVSNLYDYLDCAKILHAEWLEDNREHLKKGLYVRNYLFRS